MVDLQVTAFHIDFSTLDIEKGQKALPPFGINYTIQPTLKVEGSMLDEKEQVQPEEPVSASKRRRRCR